MSKFLHDIDAKAIVIPRVFPKTAELKISWEETEQATPAPVGIRKIA